MQQTAASTPSSTSPNFAGLLAALTSPTPKTAWNTDDLADDVATLSYEHALRTHSRYRSPDPGEWGFAQAADLAAAQARETRQSREANQADAAPLTPTATLPVETGWGEDDEPNIAHGLNALPDKNKKCSSITIRLSKPECDQLRKRAAEAGLTVSAYLRSCTFEAEALRAQVKEVLAELRSATSVSDDLQVRKPKVVRRSWSDWFMRFMPGWNPSQRMARV
jgi:hypothetical protein